MPKVGALALVKAHPLVFGAFVAVAIGVVIYNIVKTKQKKHKKHAYSNSSSRPNDGGNDGPADFYYYDASTKSVTNSAAPVESKAPENNLRRRSTAQNSSSTVPKDPEAADEMKSKSTVSKEVQTESVDCNRNDINKVLPSKDLSVAMSVDEKINDFLRNIPVLDSTDNNDETASEDSITKPIRNCCCNCDSHSAEDSCSSSASSSSVSSSWSNVSLTDADNIRKRKKSRKSRASSVCSIETETSVGTVLSGDSKLCRGCEEKPVNTHAQPCNHRYMCSDCAMRIFKLYKRCKVCRARIERIVVED